MRLLQREKLCAILMLAFVLLLSGCSIRPEEEEPTVQITYEPGVSIPVISPYQQTDQENPYRQTFQTQPQEWALYYRMREEDVLIRVMSPVDIRDKTLEESLIEALIEGPKFSPMQLSGVFNSGTKIVRKDSEGDTLLITLSHHFLDTPADMPSNWQENPQLRSEILLRRRLAIESIVSTITEETSYLAVQLYVASDEKDTEGRRISRAEIYGDETDAWLSPVMRSEEHLLTHYNAAEIILQSLKNKKFDRLYQFVSGSPAEDTFLVEMYSSGKTLTEYSLSTGMVSSDGQNAILVADLTFINAGGVSRDGRFTLRIEQEDNLWKITYDTLKRMLEAT